jgi:hypothetical protein
MKKTLRLLILSIITIGFTNAQTASSNEKYKKILTSNIFLRSNGLTSLISLNFTTDNQYTMQVITVNQIEVVNVRGTYIFVSKGNNAYLKLVPLRVNKSIGYNSFQDFSVDYFIKKNIYYLLRKFTENDAKKYATESSLLAQFNVDENKVPLYLLEGRVNFYSEKKITQTERSAIENKKAQAEKKKIDLEEKLKGW